MDKLHAFSALPALPSSAHRVMLENLRPSHRISSQARLRGPAVPVNPRYGKLMDCAVTPPWMLCRKYRMSRSFCLVQSGPTRLLPISLRAAAQQRSYWQVVMVRPAQPGLNGKKSSRRHEAR